jgi:ATP-dependent Clp protease adaptor protein ClpS
MMNVHKKGRGTVGIYTWDIATTKTSLVKRLAKENEFPLKCTIEKA